MSRQQILARLLKDRDFFDLSEGEETPRYVYVSADIKAALEHSFDDNAAGEWLGRFRFWLDWFVDGALLFVSQDPRDKPSETQLARVEDVKDEFWSIGVTEPGERSGIRSLGAFHALDEFIAVTWALRDDIGDDFDGAVVEAQNKWKEFFDQERPHRGNSLNEYLTNFQEIF